MPFNDFSFRGKNICLHFAGSDGMSHSRLIKKDRWMTKDLSGYGTLNFKRIEILHSEKKITLDAQILCSVT